MFDTLKLIYTQDEALELVSRYEKVYNKKIEELEEENKKLKEVYEACNLDSINKAFRISNLEMENKKLKEENNELKEKIKNMEKAEKRFFELMKNYVMNKKD